MKLIAIVGKKRSGKDTTADYVISQNGTKWQLAGPIKEALYNAWIRQDLPHNLTLENFDGQGYDREKTLIMNNTEAYILLVDALEWLKQQYNLDLPNPDMVRKIIEFHTLNNVEPWTVRRFMQTLGTDIVCTEFDSMFWIKTFACNYLDNLYSGYKYYVVPDVRQKNELDSLRAMGATIIFVERDEANHSTDTHITEAGLPPLASDIVIKNDGTLEELFDKINKVI